MQLVGYADSASFLASASELLLADEPRHNLILGLSATLAESPAMYPEFDLWTVEDARRCVAAALMTPPHNLVLARPSTQTALDFMVQALHREGADLPGVTGALPEAERFAAIWAELTGSRARVGMRQAIYKITSPRIPRERVGRYAAGDRRRSRAPDRMGPGVRVRSDGRCAARGSGGSCRRPIGKRSGRHRALGRWRACIDGGIQRPNPARDPHRPRVHAARAAPPADMRALWSRQ